MTSTCAFTFNFQHYKPAEVAGLKLFSVHCLEHEVSEWDCKLSSNGTLQIQLPFKKVLFEDAPLYIWVYARRYLAVDGTPTEEKTSRPFVVRIGVGYVRLSAQPDEKQTWPIIDAGVTPAIGHVAIRLPSSFAPEFVKLPESVPHMMHLVPYPESHGCEQLTTDTQRQLESIHGKLKKTNISAQHLERFMFLTVQQACGNVPMWCFPLLHLRQGTDRAYLENLLRNAQFLSGITKPASNEDYAELLSEMQTMAVRNQLYVVDCSRRCCGKDITVDDWTNPLQYEQLSEIGAIDCEDATLRMLQEAQMLSQLQIEKSGILKTLQQMEQQYVSFFCGMTLFLPPQNKWVYHAACLKLDRKYVLEQLHIQKPAPDATFLPAVLMEGTAYTTGCWDYATAKGKQKLLADSQIRFHHLGTEATVKVPVEVTKSQKMYGEIQSLISPELFYHYGLPQIELSYKDALAAPASLVLSYSPDVKFHPVKIPNSSANAIMIQELQSMLPKAALPKLTKGETKLPAAASTPVQYACCFRSVDWTADIQQLFATAMKTSLAQIKACTIRVDDNLKFEYVYE
jgi:hypothetical protein